VNSMVSHAQVEEEAIPENITGGRNVASARLLEEAGVVASAPLTAEDVARIYRLRKIVECDLARRAALLLRPVDMERLERHIQLLCHPGTSVAVAASAYESFFLGLLWPAASNAELHTVESLITAVRGTVERGLDRAGLQPVDLVACRHCLRDLLRAFRTGDPDQAETAMRQHLDDAERLTLWLARGAAPTRCRQCRAGQ
jgi:DNA-binding GntR family transcriptional regulator